MALLLFLAACATNSVTEEPSQEPDIGVQPDSGAAQGDAGDAASNEAGDHDVNLDAERPLICGKTGFCETRLPTSDVGAPLSLQSVWVVSSNDVWTVSAEGFILHWDGTSWTTAYRAAHALYAVWGTATDVWAAGERGLLLHSSAGVNGGAWMRVETGHAKDIHGIYGSSEKDVWFGYDGAVEHFDGSTLTSYDLGDPTLQIRSVFGRAGFGTYALYAGGCTTCTGPFTSVHPVVFELVPGQVTDFNRALWNVQGIHPCTAVVTDAPDDDHRIFVFGYEDLGNGWTYRYGFLGQSSSKVTVNPLKDAFGITETNYNQYPSPPLLLSWANDGVDVRVHSAIGTASRWDGTTFAWLPSIDMGFDFVPRKLFGIHGNATDEWLVGDGFALKGPK
ncbi:hypothetical protein AKJ09_06971 [Labilithrix luteola]|uniref:Uncharacterized protein n=1 Tax=Labilithrix luteola TaxID=1391654 RepID=A0A0K1Q3K0_9BACT|nr:hypothetical protein AKJ09_06971 [Labilithrix luteola]